MFRLICILLFTISLLNGQSSIEGQTYDVGTRKVIPHVGIQRFPSKISFHGDHEGRYSIYSNSPSSQLDSFYAYINKNIFYTNSGHADIYLHSTMGKQLHHFRLVGEKWELPSIPFGYYIMTLVSKSGHRQYMLFSDGVRQMISSKNGIDDQIILKDTSLLFTKDSFYEREIALSNLKKTKQINLLAYAYDNLEYFHELIRYEGFEMIEGSPSKTNFGEIQSIKILFDFISDTIYYINTKKYTSHYFFAKEILGFEGSSWDFYLSQYQNNSNRMMIAASINYHKNINKYVLDIASYNEVTCEQISNLYKKVIGTSYLKNRLFFYVNNLKWNVCSEIPIIDSEELYFGQNYQALNIAENYGYLKKLDISQVNTIISDKHDILLVNGIPNDLPVVSGIITTEFQTPLSHINILSHNRNTPNMALKTGWNDTIINNHLGKLVHLSVQNDSFSLREATINEATFFWNEREPNTEVILPYNSSISGLKELENIDYSAIDIVGGKAANFSELVRLHTIPLPEDYFAIPFYYYDQHLEENGIDTFIEHMLQKEEFFNNMTYRHDQLSMLREKIIKSPINKTLVNSIKSRINNFDNFSSYRFRSSSNAEDLNDFSGAGLYSSFTAKRNHNNKTIENAVRKVWASLWNLAAFEEREYYKINHLSCKMAILVHRSFPDEDANGVVITKNLYNINHAYTINAQYKEYSIVEPEPNILHDLILCYTLDSDGQKYTIEYLSHSNVKELGNKTVLSDDEIRLLADYCTSIKDYYYHQINHNCKCEYNNFAVDIEFKIDSQVEERKLYIKQVRIYKNN